MYKYDFKTNFFKKIICWERRSFAALSSDLKHIFSMKKNIDYSSSLPYLIDINWLIGFIFPVSDYNGKVGCK